MDNGMTKDESGLIARWVRKFACAFRGVAVGVRGENSFVVHGVATAAVLAAGVWLQLPQLQWLLLVLCIATVLSAELFNSALERLARAISAEDHPDIRDALDVASAAVLIAAVGAAIVGLVLLARPILSMLFAA